MAQEQMYHDLNLQQRQKLTMTGVTEVISFDETAVVLQTGLGTLMVHGQGLQLQQLSTDGGQDSADGSISAIVYEEHRQRAWLRRLMR